MNDDVPLLYTLSLSRGLHNARIECNKLNRVIERIFRSIKRYRAVNQVKRDELQRLFHQEWHVNKKFESARILIIINARLGMGVNFKERDCPYCNCEQGISA